MKEFSLHTPGPWEYDVRKAELIAPEVAPLGIKTGAAIWGPNYGPSPADGRLCAAAPDLLAACQEFIRKVDAGEARSTRSYAQMTAAVAKATESK